MFHDALRQKDRKSERQKDRKKKWQKDRKRKREYDKKTEFKGALFIPELGFTFSKNILIQVIKVVLLGLVQKVLWSNYLNLTISFATLTLLQAEPRPRWPTISVDIIFCIASQRNITYKSKKICRPKMNFWSGATFILRWSCFVS